jgi:polar amino acid transport system substrate-binding protein
MLLKRSGLLSLVLAISTAMAACGPTAGSEPTRTPLPAKAEEPIPAPPTVSKPAASPAASPGASPAASPAAETDVLASERPLSPMPPPGNMPEGTLMRTIQDRGKLVAGVKDDVRLFGFLSPRTGQVEGFDVDIVKEIARAIFGDESHLELKAVTSAQRIPELTAGTVDLVAATMTVTAPRKQEIDFSEVYYNAVQKVLVKKDAPYTGIMDLSGKRVCAAKGSTSERNISAANPQAEVVQADKYPDCLLLLQQGRADAISTDDVILAGLADTDPDTKIVGEGFFEEPYGIGVAKNRAEFVAFINGVLQQVKTSSTWKEIHARWLGKYTSTPEPPKGMYTS